MKGITPAILLSLALSHNALAGTMGTSPDPLRPVVTLSLGPVWTNPGKSQTILLQKDLPQTYTSNRQSNTLFSGELFAGLQAPLFNRFHVQFGLTVAATTSANLSGDVWQNANPEYDNFVYSYKISHSRVAMKAKLLTDFQNVVQPYISVSVGPGFNQAFHYSSMPKIPEVFEEAPFNPRTIAALTYTLGAGIQKSIYNHWAMGAGYEFADWGRSKLARAFNQTLESGLRLNHHFTHQLQISLTFIA
ncbi:MAG: porin family protein [Tatlockia sp.]|nr:porin family protein [Tatlockia sp.]